MLRAVISSNARRQLSHTRSSYPLQSSVITRKYSSNSPEADVPYKAYEADEQSLKQEAPNEADVVVIGGGVSGCSVLYNLAKLGVTNTVMLEKDALTAGTTWHTAGLVWRARPSDTESELITRGHTMMTTLEEETGVHTGWINNGGLFLARNKERLDEFKRFHTLAKVYGIETHVLTPKETQDLYPHCRIDDLYGSIHSPEDGTIDPAGYCEAMARGATSRGAKVLQKCSVTGIDVGQDDFGIRRVQAVHTDRGTIKTKCVVNCAGVWAQELGAMAGVNTPLCAMRHAYVVTERIEGIQNMPNMRDHDASIYFKLQGDTLQIGGYEPFPIFIDKMDKNFAFSLYDLDWDVFGVHIEGAMHRLPVLEKIGIRSTVCGPESFTADHKPLVGESPEVRGYFLNCGYNSAGMMMSGIGEQVAKWITQGRPEFDMFSYDIRRFAHALTDNQTWIKERSHESYAKNYEIVYPHDEPLASRNMFKDALFEELLQGGCHFQERHGYERPGWFDPSQSNMALEKYDYYGSYDTQVNKDYTYYEKLKQDYTFDFPKHHELIRAECEAARNNVAVFDMSYFGKYYLTGPDAQAAADWLFTNDMRKSTGSTVYTCMCNKHGGTELDLTVSPLESGSGAPHEPKFEGRGFYLAVGGGAAQHGLSYVRDVIQDKRFDCQILDHSHDMCLISVQGPKSRDLLQALVDTDLSNEAFPFSTHKCVTLAGESCRAMRLSFVGELGLEIHVPSTSAVKVYRAIMEEGQKHGVRNAGYRAIDSLSIEKGYRHWHGDLRADDTPLESLLGFTCKLKSDVDFQGKDALLKQKAEGLKRKLVAITIDDHVCLHGYEVIRRDDEIIGYARRADYAFSLGKSIAYGYVSRPDGQVITNDYLKEGSYTLEHLGEVFPAKLHLRTPFDPKHRRVQGDYS